MTAHRASGVVVVCVLMVLAVPCLADRWGPPDPEHWSANRQFVLKVAWPDGGLTLCRAPSQSGPEQVLWSRPYVDDWPPHAAYVSNDGRRVVLRDAYARLGRGKVLVFLDRWGDVLRSYELGDLLTAEQELHGTKHTVSSVWWSEPGWFSYLRDDTLFAFFTLHGSIQCFQVTDGSRVSPDKGILTEIRSLVRGEVAKMLADDEACNREDGAILAGVLGNGEFVPVLRRLLQDRSITSSCSIGGRGHCDYYGVQVEAARALGKLMGGGDVAPLVEPLFSNSTYAVREGLLDVIAKLDSDHYGTVEAGPASAALLAAWHRLSKHSEEDVRLYAARAVLDRESVEYVLAHPELLDDPDEEIRQLSLGLIARSGDKRGIPILRKALRDKSTRSLAFHGLIACQPPDLETLLRDGMKSRDWAVRLKALSELVKRGDKGAVKTLCRNVARLRRSRRGRDGFAEWREASTLCGLVVEMRISEAEPALRKAHDNESKLVRCAVVGALAALGDQEALRRLRVSAVRGDVLDRMGAIEALGAAGDTGSLPLLREASEDREPWIREAARKAVQLIEGRLPEALQ